ncbi:MAG: MarR family transcriptional regulator [Candidatus Margulisiibacteriota bacterium]|nr:MarR family transcriptional regulator [Candidatus Margulisiibacteriota bacterium]
MNQRNSIPYLKRFEQIMPLFHKSMAHMNECCVEEMNLTPHQFIVLKIIANTDNCIMSDLSNNLGVTMGNMTTMLDRLIKEGFAARKQEPDDRRVVGVRLTNKGKDIVAKATKKRQNILLNMLKKLSNKDIETMLKLIEKIVTNQEPANE